MELVRHVVVQCAFDFGGDLNARSRQILRSLQNATDFPRENTTKQRYGGVFAYFVS